MRGQLAYNRQAREADRLRVAAEIESRKPDPDRDERIAMAREAGTLIEVDAAGTPVNDKISIDRFPVFQMPRPAIDRSNNTLQPGELPLYGEQPVRADRKPRGLADWPVNPNIPLGPGPS